MQATSGKRNQCDSIKFRESLLIADCRQDSGHHHHVNDKDIHRNIYKHQNERNSCLPQIPSNQKMIEIADETPEKPRWHIWTNQLTQQNVWGDNLKSVTQKCHTITFMMNISD